MGADDTRAGRLEMLLVVLWIDAGRPEDGDVEFRIDDARERLGVGDDRAGSLEILGALGDLEEAGAVRVRWASNVGGPATVTLSRDITRDARALFGD